MRAGAEGRQTGLPSRRRVLAGATLGHPCSLHLFPPLTHACPQEGGPPLPYDLGRGTALPRPRVGMLVARAAGPAGTVIPALGEALGCSRGHHQGQ